MHVRHLTKKGLVLFGGLEVVLGKIRAEFGELADLTTTRAKHRFY